MCEDKEEEEDKGEGVERVGGEGGGEEAGEGVDRVRWLQDQHAEQISPDFSPSILQPSYL